MLFQIIICRVVEDSIRDSTYYLVLLLKLIIPYLSSYVSSLILLLNSCQP